MNGQAQTQAHTRGMAAALPAIDEEPNLASFGFAEAVAHGLSLRPRRLGSKWLYDDAGARLFERIVASPGYYLGRAEMAILQAQGPALSRALGPGGSLVELGSGSSTKVRILLDALERPRCYLPVEISAAQLQRAAEAIRRDYPGLDVQPLTADYMQDFEIPPRLREGRLLAYFPGSTLCNLLPANSIAFLRRMGRILGPRSLFLAGVDLKKDEAVLLAAYNDPGGPIWQFNLNIVDRMNRELGAGLDRDAFRHEAVYNRAAGRIEAAIVPQHEQEARVAGRRYRLPAGERIVLEYSHKYRVEEFQALARQAGWRALQAWTDGAGLFSLHLLENEAAE